MSAALIRYQWVFFVFFQFFLAPPERCVLPRWYSGSYQEIYDALVRLVPRFPANLHLLPVYTTDFTMFESGEQPNDVLVFGIGLSLFFVLCPCLRVLILLFCFVFRWAAFQSRLWEGHGRVPVGRCRPDLF